MFLSNVIFVNKYIESHIIESRLTCLKLKGLGLPTSSAATSNFENSSASGSVSAIGARYHGLLTLSIHPKMRKRAIGSIEKAFNMGVHVK